MRCKMDPRVDNAPLPLLSSQDLEEIDRFHTAWCEENNVSKTDERAVEVASALIDWYVKSPSYRQRAKLDNPPDVPVSQEIEALMKDLGQAK